MKVPRRTFYAWQRVLRRCQCYRPWHGRKRIRCGRCICSLDLPAGQAIDVLVRLIAQWLSERLGQQFIIETGQVLAAISRRMPWCVRLRTVIRCS